MNQTERLMYLVKTLCEESGTCRYQDVAPEDARRVLRGLMNVRMPGPVTKEFLQIQDAFLTEEAAGKGVVNWSDIPTVKEQYHAKRPGSERMSVWQGDITRLKVDAIVNAANSQLLGCFIPCHGCIDNAIHSAAGIQLREECRQIMEKQGHEEPTGGAKITKGYNLPARYVLHTVGPIISGRLTEKDCELLASCYQSCLQLAEEKGLESIAFCCISTGEFHFPNDRAAEIAVETVSKWQAGSSIKRVIFNVFRDEDLHIYERSMIQ